MLSGAAMSRTAQTLRHPSLHSTAINRPAAAAAAATLLFARNTLTLITVPNTVVDRPFFLLSNDLGLKEATIRYSCGPRGENLMECPLWGSTPTQTNQKCCFSKGTG